MAFLIIFAIFHEDGSISKLDLFCNLFYLFVLPYMPIIIFQFIKFTYVEALRDKELDILAELFFIEKEKRNEKLLEMCFTCAEFKDFQTHEMLGYLDRKLQKFEKGDKGDGEEDVVIQSLRMREARSQRIRTETIRERLYRMLFDFTPPWKFEPSYDEIQAKIRKWKEGKKERLD